jgi:hypothetical protein
LVLGRGHQKISVQPHIRTLIRPALHDPGPAHRHAFGQLLAGDFGVTGDPTVDGRSNRGIAKATGCEVLRPSGLGLSCSRADPLVAGRAEIAVQTEDILVTLFVRGVGRILGGLKLLRYVQEARGSVGE